MNSDSSNSDKEQNSKSTGRSKSEQGTDTCDSRSAIELLRLIKERELDPKTLNPDTRRICVQHLYTEGLTTSEMAHLLRCNERTIERDRREIREANSLKLDPGFADRIAGDLLAESEQVISRIRRAARDAAATPGDRIAAERNCFDIRCQLIDRLQSLGYLPNALRRTEFSFRTDGSGPSNVDLNVEVNQLMMVVQQEPSLSGYAAEIEALQAQSNKALLTERVADAKQRLTDDRAQGQQVNPTTQLPSAA
ncbi:MAG: hypothetical protein JNM86_00050 [Phycisphaerae bacterium]|nr:hypothetical protein [Phycisphaerae bacterium]